MRIWHLWGPIIPSTILSYHQILFTCTWSVLVSIAGDFCFCYSFVGVLWGFLNHYSLLPLSYISFSGEILYFSHKGMIFQLMWFQMYIFSPIFLSLPPPPVFSHQPIPICSKFYWVISFVNSLALPNLPYLVPGHQF